MFSVQSQVEHLNLHKHTVTMAVQRLRRAISPRRTETQNVNKNCQHSVHHWPSWKTSIALSS